MITSITITVLALAVILLQLQIRLLRKTVSSLMDGLVHSAEFMGTMAESILKTRRDTKEMFNGLCSHLKVEVSRQEEKMVFNAKK